MQIVETTKWLQSDGNEILPTKHDFSWISVGAEEVNKSMFPLEIAALAAPLSFSPCMRFILKTVFVCVSVIANYDRLQSVKI